MSATDDLRAMLDERGVDYRVSATGYSIDIGPYTTAYANRSDTTLDVSLRQVTPAQAIAATLGDVPRLQHFWTHDGTLHIEATRMPTRIVVCEGGTCEFVPKRELDASEAENANLRERITTQKQTIQAYRDESREWREVAELTQAENAKLREEFNKMDVWHSKELTAAMDENARLRELVRDMHAVISDRNSWWDCMCKDTKRFANRMRELGVEVEL